MARDELAAPELTSNAHPLMHVLKHCSVGGAFRQVPTFPRIAVEMEETPVVMGESSCDLRLRDLWLRRLMVADEFVRSCFTGKIGFGEIDARDKSLHRCFLCSHWGDAR